MIFVKLVILLAIVLHTSLTTANIAEITTNCGHGKVPIFGHSGIKCFKVFNVQFKRKQNSKLIRTDKLKPFKKIEV